KGGVDLKCQLGPSRKKPRTAGKDLAFEALNVNFQHIERAQFQVYPIARLRWHRDGVPAFRKCDVAVRGVVNRDRARDVRTGKISYAADWSESVERNLRLRDHRIERNCLEAEHITARPHGTSHQHGEEAMVRTDLKDSVAWLHQAQQRGKL